MSENRICDFGLDLPSNPAAKRKLKAYAKFFRVKCNVKRIFDCKSVVLIRNDVVSCPTSYLEVHVESASTKAFRKYLLAVWFEFKTHKLLFMESSQRHRLSCSTILPPRKPPSDYICSSDDSVSISSIPKPSIPTLLSNSEGQWPNLDQFLAHLDGVPSSPEPAVSGYDSNPADESISEEINHRPKAHPMITAQGTSVLKVLTFKLIDGVFELKDGSTVPKSSPLVWTKEQAIEILVNMGKYSEEDAQCIDILDIKLVIECILGCCEKCDNRFTLYKKTISTLQEVGIVGDPKIGKLVWWVMDNLLQQT